MNESDKAYLESFFGFAAAPDEPATPHQAAEPAPSESEWLHLKQYGYAPGDYMNKCHTCGKVVAFVDKRATICRPCAEARHALAASHAPRAVAEPVKIPAEIRSIIESLHTQDNRITDNPLFAVQQKRRFGGVDSEYADASVWIVDGSEVDAEEAARLGALRESGESVPDDCKRLGYIDRWEFVTGCFTEQGCKDYIRANGHNLHEPRIYAYGSYRNAEFIALRKWLMALSAAPAPTPSEDARPGKSLAAAVADSLRPYLSKGQRVIWREPFRWHGDDGLLPNHYEMFSLQSLAADFGYEVIEDCGCAGIIAARLSADGATGEQS